MSFCDKVSTKRNNLYQWLPVVARGRRSSRLCWLGLEPQTLAKHCTNPFSYQLCCFHEYWKSKESWSYLTVCDCIFCWLRSRLLVGWLVVGTRSNVTGKFWTSCLQTSQVLVPFVLNHLMAHASWTSLRSPLQLHSIFRVLPSSHTSRQILHTASSSGISSSVSSGGTGEIWSAKDGGTSKHKTEETEIIISMLQIQYDYTRKCFKFLLNSRKRIAEPTNMNM